MAKPAAAISARPMARRWALPAATPAGRFVASVLTATSAAADVGVNLLDLDALAHEMIRAEIEGWAVPMTWWHRSAKPRVPKGG